jgi:hypothetical protein
MGDTRIWPGPPLVQLPASRPVPGRDGELRCRTAAASTNVQSTGRSIVRKVCEKVAHSTSLTRMVEHARSRSAPDDEFT